MTDNGQQPTEGADDVVRVGNLLAVQLHEGKEALLAPEPALVVHVLQQEGGGRQHWENILGSKLAGEGYRNIRKTSSEVKWREPGGLSKHYENILGSKSGVRTSSKHWENILGSKWRKGYQNIRKTSSEANCGKIFFKRLKNPRSNELGKVL